MHRMIGAMRSLLVFALILLPAVAAERKQLFNGKDLTGWQLIRRDAKDPFVVENGILHTTGAHGDALYAKEKIGKATIHVVYKMSNEKGNSGVFIRIPEITSNEGDLIN